jgi:acyl-CoA reductase-like NAD-dependent aldehyde dehydrogenase
VFDHVKNSMRIAQEEIFGPVVSVIRVQSFEEAMRAANSVRYGLSASIFTSDAARVFHFVDEIEAGIVHINSGTPGGEAQLPFGGSNATGVGPREQERPRSSSSRRSDGVRTTGGSQEQHLLRHARGNVPARRAAHA